MLEIHLRQQIKKVYIIIQQLTHSEVFLFTFGILIKNISKKIMEANFLQLGTRMFRNKSFI